MRRTSGTATVLLLLLAALPAAADPALPDGDWTAPRGDAWNRAAARLRSTDGAVPRPWTAIAPPQVRGYQPGMSVWSDAALGTAGGRAVVAIGCHDHGVYLFDAASGERIWRFVTGSGVYSAPLIWHDRDRTLVLAASSDRTVYAIDARLGRRVWASTVSSYRPTLGGARLSAPCLGRVAGKPALFVGHWVFDKSLGHSLQQGGLTALDARSGERLWQVDLLDNQVSAPLFADLDGRGRLWVASADGNLRALDAETGAVLWSDRQIEPIQGTPALLRSADGPRVIIGGRHGAVRCLDAETGEQIWRFKTGNWITGSPALFRLDSGRAVVAVGSYDQRVLGLDARSGELLWRAAAGGPVYSSPAVVPDLPPTVLFAAHDHHLYGVSAADGRPRFRVFTGAPMWSSVVLGESPWAAPAAAEINGRWMIYFGSYGGTLFALPLNQAEAVGPSRPWTNLSFFGTMAVVLIVTALIGLYLTRRARTRA